MATEIEIEMSVRPKLAMILYRLNEFGENPWGMPEVVGWNGGNALTLMDGTRLWAREEEVRYRTGSGMRVTEYRRHWFVAQAGPARGKGDWG